MSIFENRKEAGQRLAHLLQHYRNKPNTWVLALPRGGVPVAFEIARALHLPMDLFLVRKLGVPGQEELAMGAISLQGIKVVNEEVVEAFKISPRKINAVLKKEQTELARRNERYRKGRSFPPITRHTIILVDDGIATGATAEAAILSLRQLKPAKIILAVPVAAASSLRTLRVLVDQLVCLEAPEHFSSVGAWYQNFEQVNDDEVCTLLAQAG